MTAKKHARQQWSKILNLLDLLLESLTWIGVAAVQNRPDGSGMAFWFLWF